ncbi:hypothetical protein KBB96_06990 [Luteolibacter ambystomatis]|uniref:Uncharacterized protein n=1 Tax=Luteolibacter ambystomatis TaxID=2824561 RepID=A0A975J245_9BACT|nr:hypothetical protein [Luteolibacter ambystomatis]QUE52633.1 hypothetical protein KBB96_06990 [Luteolibacter ambystomatis]
MSDPQRPKKRNLSTYGKQPTPDFDMVSILFGSLGILAGIVFVIGFFWYAAHTENQTSSNASRSKYDSMSQEELTRAREQEKQDGANVLRQIDEHRENTLWKEEKKRRGY